ncbi:hypothetical protein AURDEDRAFT_131692 [Auricularia subglabra TFB-10046 SS5]|uniref:Uncharacterized protein n=1 Tax=Auricularia subglabra (strain TFB-10046 / SS5) TaxID=717982 RepID=J0CSZ6_AURST|nr:hypothetical protein AURDEDRAFT_131692 [Auricularia subglabra TFB-10046 SS5]
MSEDPVPFVGSFKLTTKNPVFLWHGLSRSGKEEHPPRSALSDDHYSTPGSGLSANPSKDDKGNDSPFEADIAASSSSKPRVRFSSDASDEECDEAPVDSLEPTPIRVKRTALPSRAPKKESGGKRRRGKPDDSMKWQNWQCRIIAGRQIMFYWLDGVKSLRRPPADVPIGEDDNVFVYNSPGRPHHKAWVTRNGDWMEADLKDDFRANQLFAADGEKLVLTIPSSPKTYRASWVKKRSAEKNKSTERRSQR